MAKKYHKDLKVTEAPGSERIIEGEIPFEVLDAEYQKLLKSAYQTIEVPGFRAGKAPETIAKQHINDLAVLDRAAEEVFKKEYPEIITHFELFPIDHPQISITKLAKDNPLGFKITVTVMPKIELPKYKTIAAEENKKVTKTPEVTDKDVDAAIKNIQEMIAHQEHHKNHPEDKGENHDHKLDLPEITDDFVKKMGDFKDIADFRAKLKENITNENAQRAKEKARIALVEGLVKDFKIDLPNILVEAELDRMMNDLNGRISASGLKPADYFAQAEKKEADIRKEWRADAEKHVKTDIILAEISKQESIKPDPAIVETETKNILSHYKDADPERARTYVIHMLTNDKVFEFLESL